MARRSTPLVLALCSCTSAYNVAPRTDLRRSSLANAAAVSQRESLLSSAWSDLRRNTITHSQELVEAAFKGYCRTRASPDPRWTPPPVRSYGMPAASTGLGPVCPFASASPGKAELPLVFETTAPLLSNHECQSIVDEARTHMAAGKSSGFTYTETNKDVAVADLPNTLAWLNGEGSADFSLSLGPLTLVVTQPGAAAPNAPIATVPYWIFGNTHTQTISNCSH